MKTIELENGIGYKVFDDNNNLIGYKKDYSNEGFIYKDYDAFKNNPDEICYMSEYCCEETESQEGIISLDDAKKEGETRQTIREKVIKYFAQYDEELTEEEIQDHTEDVFDLAEWAFINTYLIENF